MIYAEKTVVYYSSLAFRRYLTIDGAISNEAKAIIRKRYPSEDSERDDRGNTTYQGFHWTSMNNADKLYRRVCRLVKRKYEESI